MFKLNRLLIAAVLAAVSSSLFANWDVYPPPGPGGTTPIGTFAHLENALQAAGDDYFIVMTGDTQESPSPTSQPFNRHGLTIILGGYKLTLFPNSNTQNYLLEVGGTGEVRIESGRVGGEGKLFHVQGGKLCLNDVHVAMSQGAPLVVEDGAGVEITNGSEVSLFHDTPTILIRGDRAGGQSQGIKSTLLVNDGGMVCNGKAGGAAISGVASDSLGTHITLRGGTSSVPTNVGLMSKVSASEGFGVYHPQPGTLVVDGEIDGTTCISMIQGDLQVSNSNALFQTHYSPGMLPVPIVYDGSMPTGDAIIAPFGFGHDPNIRISDGKFCVMSSSTNVCIRSNNFGNPSYGFPSALSNNVVVVGGWFETPVQSEHCAFWDLHLEESIPIQIAGGCPDYPFLTYTVIRVRAAVEIVGGSSYQTLEDAFAAAVNGDTINVLDDLVVQQPIDVMRQVRLQLRGHSIRASQGNMNGNPNYLFCIRGGAHLELDGLDATSNSRGTISTDLNCAFQMNDPRYEHFSGASARLTLRNVNVNGRRYGIYGTVLNQGNASPLEQTDILVVNSQLDMTAFSSNFSAGIYHPQYGHLLIDNSTIRGMDGVEICGGNFNVRNGSVIEGSFAGNVTANLLTSGEIEGAGMGILVAPHYPINVNIYGASRISGTVALKEKYLGLGSYDPVSMPFSLEFGDCWISGIGAWGGPQIVECEHAGDFRRYAIPVGSLAKFKTDDIAVGSLPVGHGLAQVNDPTQATHGWYMLQTLPPTAADEVEVVYKDPNGTLLGFSRRYQFPGHVPGTAFGMITPPQIASLPNGMTISGWYISSPSPVGNPWDFDNDQVDDAFLTESRFRGGANNLMYIYVQLAPMTNVAPPGGCPPLVFGSREAAMNAATSLTVAPPPQVQQLPQFNPESYRSMFTVRTLQLSGDGERFVNQVVLRDEVTEQLRSSISEAMRNAPLARLSSGSPSVVRIDSIPGIFYSVQSGATLDSMVESQRVLAGSNELNLTLQSYGSSGFYRLNASPNPE